MCLMIGWGVEIVGKSSCAAATPCSLSHLGKHCIKLFWDFLGSQPDHLLQFAT
jgi:hypothetical protein